jgi:hypothetical protein
MAQQERPVIAPNPVVRGIQSVTFFDKMLVRINQRRGKDFGEDSFSYFILSIYFWLAKNAIAPIVPIPFKVVRREMVFFFFNSKTSEFSGFAD